MNELYNDKVTETQGDREKARRERQESDVRWFLSKPEGRRIIWWVLSICGCFKTSFTGDPNTTIFQEGRRSVGLEILNLILRAKPSAFNEMQQEFASEAKSDEAMDKILAKQSDRS
jgi:hypothetical protein